MDSSNSCACPRRSGSRRMILDLIESKKAGVLKASNIRGVRRGHAPKACGSRTSGFRGMLGLGRSNSSRGCQGMSPHDAATYVRLRSRSASAATDLKSVVQALCTDYSTEVTPTSAAKIASFRDLLPLGTDVYITSLAGTDYRETVSLAARLRREGYNPVPHVAARNIVDRASLADYLGRATGEADVTQVLAIAGAPEKSCGEFADSMQLLDTGLFEKYGIRTIGVAGHPESCNCCGDAALRDALRWKNAFAARSGLDCQRRREIASAGRSKNPSPR